MMLKPYKHQQDLIDRFKNDDFAALFLDAGTGKTLVALNLYRQKCNMHQMLLKCVIFSPAITLRNWKYEFSLNTKVDPRNIGVVMGTKAKRLKIIKDDNHKILIINYEATRTMEILNELTAFAPQFVICDESHLIKSPKSKMFTSCKGIARNAWYKYLLTGTPISKDALDLWSQYMVMDNGKTFGERYYSFKNRYFVNANQGWSSAEAFPNWKFNETMRDELKQKLARTSARIKKEDCLELPDLVETVIKVEPTSEQLKHYKEIKNDLITWMDDYADDPLVVKNALTRTLRLAEILSGYMKLESGEIVKLKKNPKLDGLMSIVESTNPHKVIVFCIFKENYKDIARALEKKGVEYVEIHGGISGENKLDNVDTFNDQSNNCRVAIVNPRSGGVGINLRSAKYACYYSVGYSLIDFEQSRARNYRAGSIDFHNKITHYFLVTNGLIDETVIYTLRHKQEISNSILDIKKLLI
jgi:SNF2 family DNA or RNA helicase